MRGDFGVRPAERILEGEMVVDIIEDKSGTWSGIR